MYMPHNYAAGGITSLPAMAKQVRAAGRNGDTILAHINPEEAGILKLLGGSGRINPATGIPEFGFFKSVAKPIKRAFKSVAKAVAPIIRPLAPIIPFLPIPGLGPLSALAMKSLLTGIASGLDKQGGFDFSRGLKAGALSYGIGSLMQGAQAADGAAGTGTGVEGAAGTGVEGAAGSAVPDPTVTTPTVSNPVSNPVYDFGSEAHTSLGGAGAPSITPPAPAAAAGSSGESIYSLSPTAPQAPVNVSSDYVADYALTSSGSTGQGLSALSSGQGFTIDPASPQAASLGQSTPSFIDRAGTYLANLPEKTLNYAIENPVEATLQGASLGTTAYGAYKTKQELDAQKKEAERIMREQEKHTAEEIAFAQQVLRDYPIEYRRLTAADVQSQGMAGGGGVVALAGGRFLSGTPELSKGDGTSDSIKGSIDDKHPARLATGEFVLDARTVSEIGNGSSEAGAKKLYQMMNRVHSELRQAKRGQPSNADQYLPA